MASGSFEIKNFIAPSIIKEALLSPGCTLDESITAYLSAISSYDDYRLVIMSISSEFPAIDLHIWVLFSLSFVPLP